MLTIHITTSVGWLGAVVGFLILVIAALSSQGDQTVRAAWISMELIGWFAIVPFAVVSLLTGLAMSLGTSWGLFRHYWVIFKLLLTLIATVVLLLNMQTVGHLAGVAETGSTDLGYGLWGEVIHAGGGMVVLLLAIILSVYKPRGLTRYGLRKQYQQRNIV
ncbi:DUF2269 domain-containing protein [Virgibacillus tibetensis]|uniref:DUF2269 domain-containing protein n=1 Tax=Virgibacillus tibetensis TaxID=3042313 RepID=UPI002E18FB91